MKRSQAEDALGKLFDDVVRLLDMVEDRVAKKGEGNMPEGIMEDLEKVWEDVCELRRRDRQIRKDLGIKEDRFQEALEGDSGLNTYRKRLLKRIEQVDKSINHRLKQEESDMRVVDASVGKEKKEKAQRKSSKKRADALRRLKRRDDWLQM